MRAPTLNKSSHKRCFVKKVFLEISQNSQENISARDFLIKLQALACNFIKKESVALMFFCEFCQFIRTPFLKQPLWWLLLIVLLWFRSCKLISLNFFSIVVNIFTQHPHHKKASYGTVLGKVTCSGVIFDTKATAERY